MKEDILHATHIIRNENTLEIVIELLIEIRRWILDFILYNLLTVGIISLLLVLSYDILLDSCIACIPFLDIIYNKKAIIIRLVIKDLR